MADYKHGEMDITSQEKTFDGFVRFSSRVAIAVIIALIWMAIFIT